jgi:hypothetical protein
VFCRTAHRVGRLGSFLMACGGYCAFRGVQTAVSASPAVVLAIKVRWVPSHGVVGRPIVGELFGECCDLCDSGDELGVGPGKILGQESVGSGQVGHGGSIGCGGGSEIGNGIDRVFMIAWDFLGAESGRRGFGFEGFVVLLIGDGKINFELWPRFVVGGLSFPEFAIIRKYTRAKDKLICNAENLLGGVRGLAGGGKFDGIFDLLVKYFDRLVDVARLFHGDIILVEIGRGDFGVVGVVNKAMFVCKSMSLIT